MSEVVELHLVVLALGSGICELSLTSVSPPHLLSGGMTQEVSRVSVCFTV